MPTSSDARRLAARLVCIGFDGTTLPDPARTLLEGGVGSVILFARNAHDRSRVATLAREIKRAAPHPVLLCVDQEGGEVQRFREGFSAIPPMREVGERGDPEEARALGATLARELRSVHVDLDLAPVLDVDSNPANPVIGARSFSADPGVVARMAGAMIDGLQSSGVAACGKHFPGHGDTAVDSHEDLPVLPHDMKRLNEVELVPFRAAVGAGVAAIMTAHVVFEAIDRTRPATLSGPVINGVLRRDLGFDGVVISDDLEMKAIADRMPVGEAAVAAVTAGVDLLLCCHTTERQEETIGALARAITDGAIGRDRVRSAHRRLDRMFERYVECAG